MNAMLQRRARQAVKLVKLLRRAEWRRALRFGVGASIEHEAVMARLRPATVVDVGANVGQFSALIAALHPEARLVAFEPMPDAAATWRRVFDGRSNAVLHTVAIGTTKGEATLHVSARADSSSLLPIGEGQRTVFPGTEEAGTMRIEVAPLDAFLSAAEISRPALLKIDVQGYELEVLRGAESLLRCFDYVYVEASFMTLYEGQPLFDEVAAFLAARGFREEGRYNLSVDAEGRPVQADFLFARDGAAAG